MGKSRRDNILYARIYFSGKVYFPETDTYDKDDIYSENCYYIFMKDDEGQWKGKRFKNYNDVDPLSRQCIWQDANQELIQEWADAIGITGTGRD